MKETIIDLIRHGEPVGGQRLRGTQDDPLSELGWSQMRESVGEHSAWTKVVSSPLSRCRYFAHEMADKLSLDTHIQDGFREIGFGIWEGKTTKELMQTSPDALKKYWADPISHTPEGGERLDRFIERVHASWENLVNDSMYQHTLLVCHGGVIRAILLHVLGMSHDKMWNIDVPYANVSRVVIHTFGDDKESDAGLDKVAQLKFHQARLELT